MEMVGFLIIFFMCFILIFLGYYVWIRKIGMYKNCTRHVIGKVVGVSNIYYAGFPIPKCEYIVNGKKYSVSGPKFESGTSGNFVKSNIDTRENLPRVIKGPYVKSPHLIEPSNESLYEGTALSRLYPIGSDVDIYYDPNKPEVSYVQRPVREGLTAGIILFSLGFGFMFSFLLIWFFLVRRWFYEC